MAKPKNRPEDAPAAEAAGIRRARSYEALYKHYLPAGRQIPEEQVQTCRADVRIVLVNVKRGVAAVCGTKAQVQAVREHLPKVPVNDVVELPDIARALLFAARRVVPTVSPKEIEKALQEISGPREELLTLAELFGRRGLLDKDRVTGIRSGTGKYDMAQDGMDLASIFTENAAALKGLHPFAQEEIEKLRRTSEWLLENLTPAGARADAKKKGRTPAEDARDRLWTLVAQRHPALRRIGYYFHGDDFEQVTPRLLSRVQGGASQEEEPEADDAAAEAAGAGGEAGPAAP